MIQMTFSVKFQNQLRRTRPYVYESIEKTIMQCVQASGGKIKQEYHCLIAYFNEQSIGFWLDLLTIIETLKSTLDTTSRDLYGHICVISEQLDDDEIQILLHTLPTIKIKSGIWCTMNVSNSLNQLLVFAPGHEIAYDDVQSTFAQVDTLIANPDHNKENPLRLEISKYLKKDTDCNTVILGREFLGKRDALQWYTLNNNKDKKPLTIRFGTHGYGLCCFADALTSDLKQIFFDAKVILTDEILKLHEMLFHERLRDECSEFSVEKCKRFFTLLAQLYIKASSILNLKPIIILENLEKASSYTTNLFSEIYEETLKSNNVLLYGTCSSTSLPNVWKKLFSNILSCESDNIPAFDKNSLNDSLWEIAFAFELFGRYFPGGIFPQLFEEEGKNPQSIKRSLDLLIKNNIIKSPDDPQPQITGFVDGVEDSIPERANIVRNMVKNRLLAWVSAGKLTPCFNLLKILNFLKYTPTPLLVLESIRQDVINGTYSAVEESIADGTFDTICGEDRAGAIFYIYKTLKALNYGNENEIRETFKLPQVTNITIDAYKAQILTINAIYKLGISDEKTALDEIKEAMMISQNVKNRIGMSGVYRLFSLVHFYNKNVGDAMEYISFAVEEAERKKDYDEMSVVAYYAAAANFNFGNIPKAQRLILEAERAAIFCGRKEWALRSQFLMGRFNFEIGLYREAYLIFKSLLGNWDGSDPLTKEHFKVDKTKPQNELIINWLNRTKLFLSEKQKLIIAKTESSLRDEVLEEEKEKFRVFFNDNPDALEPLEFLNGDGQIFEIEAAYMQGEYQKVIDLCDRVLASPFTKSFQFLEQPDWSSGFAQCELLLYSMKDYWQRMVTVWWSLAVSRLDVSRSGEAVHTMQQITRDERMADIDPNAAFYFFANFIVLDNTESSEVDLNTAISMAFKRLQKRATKFENNDMRRTYLSNQYWNMIVFDKAREYKLI
ncbi:hypothetical protein FACS1894102_4980 [Spirochaetia bacterium]|nr:hypothetical protein FACS1894102_4980 [Spirochaetia bacterium]